MSRLWPLLAAGAAFAYLPVALLVLLLLGPRQADCVSSSSAPATGRTPTVIVGDSLTVGAEQVFRKRFPQATIKAQGGMPWSWGVGQLRASAPASGSLVAFLMGTNGGVTAAQVDALLQSFPNVSFVLMTVATPLAYTTPTNTVIQAVVAQHHDRIQVADWHARIAAQPNLLGPDHIHPASSAGVNAFVDTVAQALGPAQSGQLVANARSTGGHPPPWTQAEMEAAVARYDPQQAHVLGAIAMAETGGKQFPSWNSVAGGHWYHGPWAFQDATLVGMGLSASALDTNLDYAAKAAADLAKTRGITHQVWETWPNAATRFMAGGTMTSQTITAPQQSACLSAVFTGTSVQGPGGGITGSWAPGVYTIVKMIHDKFHVSVTTYMDHHPDEGHAVDIALGQFGNDWTDGAPGQPGTGPYWQIAQWIAANLVDKGYAWYVGHHASIHYRGRDAPGQWHADSAEVGLSNPTTAHMNHIHLSFPPWFGNAGGSPNSSFTPAHNFSSPPQWVVPALPSKW